MYLRSRETRGWRRAPEGTVLRAYELLCGYGTRPLRALCAWLGVILVAGLVLSLTGYTQPSVREPVASGASPSAVEKAAEPRAGAGAEVTASAPRQNQPWLDGFRSSIPGWTIDERLMTTTGRWAVTLSRILGAITLALFLLAVRAQVKR